MTDIALLHVRSWVSRNGWAVPASVAINCPTCGDMVTFVPGSWHDDDVTHTITTRSSCPACREAVDFWFVHPVSAGPEGSPEELGDFHIAIHPAPRTRPLMEGATHLSTELQREYKNLLKAYNAGVWDAAAMYCRRILEAIVADKVQDPKKHTPLAKGLSELGNHVALDQPLRDLSRLLRQGGNLGAHFDQTRSTDAGLAAAMLDLAEYLLAYFYVLPNEIADLDTRLASV